MRRRRYLRAFATAGATVAGGCTEGIADTGDGSPAAVTDAPDSDRTDRTDWVHRRDDFLWAERPLWANGDVRRNVFAFARRHDLAVVLAATNSTDERTAAALEEPLALAAEYGIEAWLNVGVLTDVTAPEFVARRRRRDAHLAGLERVSAQYREFFPDGRVVLWQEAPVGGAWVDGGDWNDEAVENVERLGPDVFAAQKRTIEAVAPGVDVGIFVHFPYIVESRNPETFATVTDALDRRNASPAFAFVDFYRGWYEKDVGPERANDAIRSLVANARGQVEGGVFYLGQSHTIDPGHTPSRQAIRMDLRASAAADGRGWYARTAYTATERGFDPFVPNAPVGPAAAVGRDERASTFTFARDRYLYAYASLLAARPDVRPADRFDLWVRGTAVGFHEHDLSLRTVDGEWEFVGTVSGTLDGPSPDDDRSGSVSIVRALDRTQFVGGRGALDLRIETADTSDGSTLVSVAAVPFDVGLYVPERAATALSATAGVRAFCLGHVDVRTPLAPGTVERVTVPVDEPDDPRGLGALLFPGHRTVRRRLRAFEASGRFDPESAFDLWVVASGYDGADLAASVSVPDARGAGRRSLRDVSVAASSTADGAILYGLDRARFLDRTVDASALGIEDATGTIEGAYAMPYFGSDTFLTAARAVELIEADPSEARTFSIEYDP